MTVNVLVAIVLMTMDCNLGRGILGPNLKNTVKASDDRS